MIGYTCSLIGLTSCAINLYVYYLYGHWVNLAAAIVAGIASLGLLALTFLIRTGFFKGGRS